MNERYKEARYKQPDARGTFKSKQKEFDVMVDDSMTEIIGHIPEIEYNKPKFKIKSTRTIKKTV